MAAEGRGRERGAAGGPRARPGELARWLALAGPAYAVLIVVGDDIVAGEAPGLDSTRADVARYLAEQHGEARQWLGRLLALLGIVLLAVFFARLYAALRASWSTWLPELALGAGLIAVAVHLAAYGPAAALAIAEYDLDVESAQLAFAVFGALFLLWWPAAAVALLATAAIVLREGLLPRWFGWVTLAQGLAFVAGLAVMQATYAGFVAYPLFWVWLVAAAVVLVRVPRSS